VGHPPQAKTKIDEKGTLIILTCARNIGPLMRRKIQPEIEKQFYSAGLLAEIGYQGSIREPDDPVASSSLQLDSSQSIGL